MLFYCKNDYRYFDSYSSVSNNSSYNGIRLNTANSQITKVFPSNVRDIWISYNYYEDYRYDAFKNFVNVCFDDGRVVSICLKYFKELYLPDGNGTNQTKINLSSNFPTTKVWHTIRIHAWIDEDDSTVLHFSAYNDGKIIIENATSKTTGGSKLSHFSSFIVQNEWTYSYYVSEFIISDKFFGESAKIKEIPITQIKNWTKNPDTGQYYASKNNQQGTLVIDPLLLADLEKYDIVSTAINGNITREGDNIKSIELGIGDKKVSQEIFYGDNRLSVDIGNDLTLLPNITIETKG